MLGRSQFTFLKRKTLDSGGQVAVYMSMEVALLPYVRDERGALNVFGHCGS